MANGNENRHWNAESVDQTYQSCVDFTMGGAGGGVNGTEKRESDGRDHARRWL